ncbi:MAG: hypothetical protein CVV32_04040 [Methanomicrobiales archaeon HGW-Methanomicrobiales-3]|jgi:hypothetical protein|nr:MAG: hypothetical protein CVV32_04040 [Methanomicrobiales archaeon HGW-Methanomicrobiales-3]
MRNRLLAAAVAVLLLLGFAVAPAHADVQDQLLDVLGGAELGYQKDASDYIREAEKDKERCEENSRSYNAKFRAYILQIKGEMGNNELPYVGHVGSSDWDMMLNVNAETRVALQETPMMNDFYEKNPMARIDWSSMKYSCSKAEIKYNKAFELTRPDDYQQHARIFRESAELYDIIGDADGASEVREAESAAMARAEAKDEGFSDCLIVTATFGSPMAGEVQLVRSFRDDTMQQTWLGSRYVTALNAVYYSFSPSVARAIDENPSAKPVMRLVLAPLIGIVLISQVIYSLLAFSPEIATVVFIVAGGALVGLVYLMPLVLAALWIAVRKGQWRVSARRVFLPFVLLWTSLLPVLAIGVMFRIDLVAALSSGLLFFCTAILIAGAMALQLAGYLGFSPKGQDE